MSTLYSLPHVIFKSGGSEVSTLAFISQSYCLLAMWPWACYLTSFALFFMCTMEVVIELFWGLNELMWCVKYLEQCLRHGKCSVIISYFYLKHSTLLRPKFMDLFSKIIFLLSPDVNQRYYLTHTREGGMPLAPKCALSQSLLKGRWELGIIRRQICVLC